MNKKYEITDEKKTIAFGVGDEVTEVHRIRALRDIGDFVQKGDLGGFIQSDLNLSHDGECWIADNAMAYEKAKVRNNACMYNTSKIYGNALIEGNAMMNGHSQAFDYAYITNDSVLNDNSSVYGHGVVKNSAELFHNSSVTGLAVLGGNCYIDGEIRLRGKSIVLKKEDYMSFNINYNSIVFSKCLDKLSSSNYCILVSMNDYCYDITEFIDIINHNYDGNMRNTLLHLSQAAKSYITL